MWDEYTRFQYRNWFNDEGQRTRYGVSASQERGVGKRLAQWTSDFVAPLIVILLFPPFAVYLIFTAGTNASKYFDKERIPRWQAPVLLLVPTVWVFLHLSLLPGRRYDGPVCESGSRPKYKRNGFAFFLLTFSLVGFLAWLWGPSAFNSVPELCFYCVVFSMLAALAAYTKALLGPDSNKLPKLSHCVADIFYGLEVYPRIGELHLKLALIRLGAVLNLFVLWSCFFAQISSSQVAFVMIGLQFLHAGRRFWNEECYAHSLEVAHYKPLSCRLRVLLILSCLIAGSIIFTYLIDRQKFLVKHSKGKCMIGGRMADAIHAFYADENGMRRTSVLLFSGYWGWARHLNYTSEFITYCLLSLPALSNINLFSAIPPLLIFILLLVRGHEDFEKCRRKYGPYWQMYCTKVPYAYVPWLW